MKSRPTRTIIVIGELPYDDEALQKLADPWDSYSVVHVKTIDDAREMLDALGAAERQGGEPH